MSIDEGRIAVQDMHSISRELMLEDLDLAANGRVELLLEVIHGQVFLEPVALAIQSSLPVSAEINDRFT